MATGPSDRLIDLAHSPARAHIFPWLHASKHATGLSMKRPEARIKAPIGFHSSLSAANRSPLRMTVIRAGAEFAKLPANLFASDAVVALMQVQPMDPSGTGSHVVSN